MLKKIFNLKVLLISALFTLLFGCSVFADTFKLPAPLPSDMPSEHYVITKNFDTYCLYVPSNENFKYFLKKGSGQYGEIYCGSPYYYYQVKDGKWELQGSSWSSILLREDGFYSGPVVYSTDSIKDEDGGVFFSGPVKLMDNAKEVPKLIIKQLKVIIPVGISALCLVVLVPYLIQSIKRFV